MTRLETPKRFLRTLLYNRGFDIHSLPLPRLTLRSLEKDLPVLVDIKDPCIIDVGANRGQTIDLFLRSFRKPRIIAFEPNPKLAEILEARFRSLSTIAIEPRLLSTGAGQLNFKIFENDELSSVLELDPANDNPFAKTKLERVITVEADTLDRYAKRHELDRIHLLKIDTQGFDLEVLKGGSNLLEQNAVDVILIEVNFAKIYCGQSSFGEIERYLGDRGY